MSAPAPLIPPYSFMAWKGANLILPSQKKILVASHMKSRACLYVCVCVQLDIVKSCISLRLVQWELGDK
jgi:hypothetical protein